MVFDETFGEVGRDSKNNRFDFGGDSEPFILFCRNFHAVTYFQWDSNSLVIFARWQHHNE